MTVIEAVFESFVLIVIHPIIGSGAGTLPRGVRVVSHDAFIDVVVVTGQRRSGIEKHLVFHRRNVFGRTVSVKNHVQQVGFGRLGLGGFRRGILYECNGFDQRGIGDRDEFDLVRNALLLTVFSGTTTASVLPSTADWPSHPALSSVTYVHRPSVVTVKTTVAPS
ncbi:MAG: hypothetical protein ACLUQ6_01815 [Alistipes onderdonkii]